MTKTSKLAISLIAGLTLMTAAGCAKKNPQNTAGNAPPTKAAAAPTAQAAIPKGHPFAKITKGMPEADVVKILGQPTDRRDYVTGKAFIPYYYGKDTSRSDWIYKGKGHVVFVRNRYTNNLTVLEVLYDPSTP
jgi:hypothetical protein